MRLLNKHPATLYRHSEGEWSLDGTWNEGSLESTEIRGNFQPSFRGGTFQKVLPSGVQHKDMSTFYTKTLLKTGDDNTKTNADYLTVFGKHYEVFEVDPWYAADRLSHYQALLIRRDKLDGIT